MLPGFTTRFLVDIWLVDRKAYTLSCVAAARSSGGAPLVSPYARTRAQRAVVSVPIHDVYRMFYT